MRKIVFFAAAMLVAVNAFADEWSGILLGELADKVAGWGDYRVEFTVTVDGQAIGGSYKVSGDKYRVQTPDIEVICDGTTRWEVNRTDRTVTIDPVDPADRTVMANPTRLFDFLDGSYDHRYVGPALINGVNCNWIELWESPAGGGSAGSGAGFAGRAGTTSGTTGGGSGQTIEAYLSTRTDEPVRLVYRMPFLDADVVIDVVDITPHLSLGSAIFSYRSTLYAGYEEIDFR